jgi:hypothetical protein
MEWYLRKEYEADTSTPSSRIHRLGNLWSDHRNRFQPYNRVQYSYHPRMCGAGCLRCYCLELFSQVSLYITIHDCMYFSDFHSRYRLLFSRVNHTKEFYHV